MKHQVIPGGVGKAQERFIAQGIPQLVMGKQPGQQTAGVVTADGAEDEVDLRIPKGPDQIRCPFRRMVPDVVQPHQRMGKEAYLQSHLLQPPYSDLPLEADRFLTQDPTGEAHDPNGTDHRQYLLCFWDSVA